MARICMVTVDHVPLDDRIFYKECWSLKKAGHELIILCAADPEGRVRDMSRKTDLNPDGKTDWVIDGVRIVLVPLPGTFFQRLLHKFFLDRFFKEMVKKGAELGADVYHAHESVSFYIARKIRDRTGARVVYDEHGALLGTSIKDRLIKSYCLDDPDLFSITANPLTRGSLLHRNPRLRNVVINNYPRQDLFVPAFRTDKVKDPVIVHEGNLPFDRGLQTMIEVMRRVCQRYPRVRLKIIGETTGKERVYLNEKCKAYGLEENIFETGWLDYPKVGEALEEGSIGLILKTHTAKNFLVDPPMKLFHYLIYGMAVVDVGFPETTRMLNEFNTGVTVRHRSVEHIVEALSYLLEDPERLKAQCKRAFKARHALKWETEEQKLWDFYHDEVLNDRPFLVRE